MALENKLITMVPGYDVDHDYRIKFTLEKVFNQVVQWITFNHIEDSTPYIHIKQREMLSVIYALPDASVRICASVNARQILVDKGWIIVDRGLQQ